MQTDSNPGPFTKSAAESFKPMLEAMFKGAFLYLIEGRNAPTVDTVEFTDDTLRFGDYSIVRTAETEEVRTILGVQQRQVVVYTVYVVVCTAHETRWQPADYDDKEIGKERSLDAAFARIIMSEVEAAMANYREGEAYARDHAEESAY